MFLSSNIPLLFIGSDKWMSEAAAQLIREVVARGYQIEPKAFNLLLQISKNTNLKALVEEVIKLKGEGDRTIKVEDVEHLIPKVDVELKRASVEQEIEEPLNFKILRNYVDVKASEGVEGFQQLFLSRYQKMLELIRKRKDSSNIRNITELKESKTPMRIAGLIYSKTIKRGAATIVLEDVSGRIEATAFESSIIKNIQEAPLDSMVIATVTSSRKNIYIIDSLSLPDVPDHVPSVSKKRVYAVLTSDLHVGNKYFLSQAFKAFINWLNKKDDEVAARVRYLLICGDVIDGVGIYPNQEKELEITNVKQQFNELKALLKSIPPTIHIFINPGNHEPVRQAAPQPPIPKDYAAPLYELQNLTMISNPAWLEIEGVKVLMYHGRSLEDVVATTPGLRVERPALAMKVLLKARHLAPIYGRRTPILPAKEDLLIIDEIPDIFHAGHVHILDSERYRGCLLLNSGTWQNQTSYQLDMGINPTPAILPIVDLSTLQILTLDFTKL